MSVTLITDKKMWNDFVFSHTLPDGGFLQMYEWGEFQAAYGRKVFRIGLAEDNAGQSVNGKSRIVAGWQIIVMPLIAGYTYLYVPRPIGEYRIQNTELRIFWDKIKEIGRQHKAVFVRVDGASDLHSLRFSKTRYSIQPQEELVLNIIPPESQLLAEMKPKTRYNIKVAEKHGVTIKNTESRIQNQEFEDFYKLIEKTSRRQGIRPHPKKYYQVMLRALGDRARVYLASYQGRTIAAQLVVTAHATAMYVHGGSDETYKHVMAPYLMQWHAIRDAKTAGCVRYNFGGVSRTKAAWAGITRFKEGFVPDTDFVDYGPVWERPLRSFIHLAYGLIQDWRGRKSV